MKNFENSKGNQPSELDLDSALPLPERASQDMLRTKKGKGVPAGPDDAHVPAEHMPSAEDLRKAEQRFQR